MFFKNYHFLNIKTFFLKSFKIKIERKVYGVKDITKYLYLFLVISFRIFPKYTNKLLEIFILLILIDLLLGLLDPLAINFTSLFEDSPSGIDFKSKLSQKYLSLS